MTHSVKKLGGAYSSLALAVALALSSGQAQAVACTSVAAGGPLNAQTTWVATPNPAGTATNACDDPVPTSWTLATGDALTIDSVVTAPTAAVTVASITVNAGKSLALGNTITTATLVNEGTIAFSPATASAATLALGTATGITGAGTLTVGGTGGALTITGTALTKIGNLITLVGSSSSLTLPTTVTTLGAITYNPTTSSTISGGAPLVTDATGAVTGGVTTGAVTVSNGNFVVPSNFKITGAVDVADTKTISLSASNVVTGPVTLTLGGAISGTLKLAAGGARTITTTATTEKVISSIDLSLFSVDTDVLVFDNLAGGAIKIGTLTPPAANPVGSAGGAKKFKITAGLATVTIPLSVAPLCTFDTGGAAADFNATTGVITATKTILCTVNAVAIPASVDLTGDKPAAYSSELK